MFKSVINSLLKSLFFTALILLYSCANQATKEAEEAPIEFSFVFMTDIHLQPERNAVEGFSTAISEVNEIDPDFVITGGDLIMDALGQTYGRADSLYSLYDSSLKEFSVPVYNTLGNHEIYGWYESGGADRDHPDFGKKMFENRIGKRFYSFDHKGWHFIILDSVDEDGKGGYRGWITDDQIEWLRNDIDTINAKTPIVVSVHIPFITTEAQILRGSLAANYAGEVIGNSKEVLELFKDKNLKLVLQGHLHYLEELYVFGTSFITGGAVSGAWWKGPYLGTDEGFLLVSIEGNDFCWEYVNFGWKAEIN
jgi:3',5'-cyclic AMP phosphodiesterase CpdA